MAATWNKSQHTSLLLWDIDREFQNAFELYERLQAKTGHKRSAWSRLAVKSQDDILGKALSLGREVKNSMEAGIKRFGARFEKGDCMIQQHRIHLTTVTTLTPFSYLSHHTDSSAHSNPVRGPRASLRQRCI